MSQILVDIDPDFAEALERRAQRHGATVQEEASRLLRERLASDAIAERRAIQGEPKRCTGADLAAVFSSLPPLDGEYLDTVERLTKEQPPAPELPWPR